MYRFRFEEVIETTVSYSPRKKSKSDCLNCSRNKAEEKLKRTMSEQTIPNTQDFLGTSVTGISSEHQTQPNHTQNPIALIEQHMGTPQNSQQQIPLQTTTTAPYSQHVNHGLSQQQHKYRNQFGNRGQLNSHYAHGQAYDSSEIGRNNIGHANTFEVGGGSISSDRGMVNNSQPRMVGSVADINPTSGVYGSMEYNSYAHQSHSQPQQQPSHHHQLHYGQQQQQPQMSISSQMQQQQPSTSQSQQEQSPNQQFHFPEQSTSFESSPSKIADVLTDKFHEVSDVMMKGSPQDKKNLASVLVRAMTKTKDPSAAKTSTVRRQILFDSSVGSSPSSQEKFGVFQKLKPNDFQSFKVTVLPLLSAASKTLAENIIGNLEYMVEAFNHGGTIQKEEDFNSAISQAQKNFEKYRTDVSFPGVRDLMIDHLLGKGIIKIKDKSRFTKVMNYMSGLTTTEQ